MNIHNDRPLMMFDNKRSPLALNAIEIGFAVFVGIGAWLGLNVFLHSVLPFPCGSSVNDIPINCGWTEEQAWETLGSPLFSTYAVPFVLFLAISAIFFVRSIRKDVYGFSAIGNLALSFPIFGFLGFYLFSVFSLFFLPVGIALAIVATINSAITKNHKWDWVSLPFNMIWLVIFGLFICQFLNSYGD